jgi:hypothetical protein
VALADEVFLSAPADEPDEPEESEDFELAESLPDELLDDPFLAASEPPEARSEDEPEPSDPLAAESLPTGTVLELLRLSVR